MYRNTRFRDLMKGLPRGSFEKIVDQQGNDKHNKGFTSWDQLIAMIYAQVSGCESLRELKASFNGHKEQHYHLGTREIKRSTLADANRNRSCELFEHVCGRLIGEAHRQVRSELKDLLYLIDSSPIPLKGLGYDEWTKDNHNYRTQGLKVHMIYAPKQELPVQMKMTAPNINDVEVGRETEIEEGATYVFDKGYYDYNWWYEIEQNNNELYLTKENAKELIFSSFWYMEFGKTCAEIKDAKENKLYTVTKKFQFWKWRMVYLISQNFKDMTLLISQNTRNTVFKIELLSGNYEIKVHYKKKKSIYKNTIKIAEFDESTAENNLIKVLVSEKEELESTLLNFCKSHFFSPKYFKQPTIDLTCCCKKDCELNSISILLFNDLTFTDLIVLIGLLAWQLEDLKVE